MSTISQPPRTVQLASSILDTVTSLEHYLERNGRPSCSFEPGAAPVQSQLPPSLHSSVDAALGALEELTTLLLGPMGWITYQLARSFDLVSMHAMYRYQIPSRFPVGETVSVAELARRCNADEETFTRLVQHAATKRFLAQPEAGLVSHTAFSAMMAAQPATSDFVGYLCEDLQPAGACIPDALIKWPGSTSEPNRTGHNIATGTTGTFWDSLESNPERSRRFTSTMRLMQRMPGWQPAAAFEIFDWGGLSPDAVVVDVGGGDGSFAVALSERFPSLKTIFVQDVPAVIEQAKTGIPEKLRGIITPQVADFFEPQGVHGAAIYFLRKVLHDWPDEYAIRILQQLVPALDPGSRILINDHCVPPPGTLLPIQEWRLRGQDLAIMALFNSKERTTKQWKDLIKEADPRFVIESVTAMPPGPLALIVVAWE